MAPYAYSYGCKKYYVCINAKLYIFSDVFTANIITDVNLTIIIGPNRSVKTIKACQYIDHIIINSRSKMILVL
jgi:hypothetical protein